MFYVSNDSYYRKPRPRRGGIALHYSFTDRVFFWKKLLCQTFTDNNIIQTVLDIFRSENASADERDTDSAKIIRTDFMAITQRHIIERRWRMTFDDECAVFLNSTERWTGSNT